MIFIPLLTLTGMPLFKVLPIILQDFNIKAASNVGSHNVFQPKLSENQKSPLNWLSTGKEKKQKKMHMISNTSSHFCTVAPSSSSSLTESRTKGAIKHVSKHHISNFAL